jgi:hypothetical protein
MGGAILAPISVRAAMDRSWPAGTTGILGIEQGPVILSSAGKEALAHRLQI